MSTAPADGADEAAPLRSPAFPRLLRIIAVVLMIDLVLFAAWLAPRLFKSGEWSVSGLLLITIALLMVLWMGVWIVHSQTRLEGDTLIQTWLWDKRVQVNQVASLKLVHIRALEFLIAPRLLVRRRGGGLTWFHSADAALLIEFAHRAARAPDGPLGFTPPPRNE